MVTVKLTEKARKNKFESISILRMTETIVGLALHTHSKDGIKKFMCVDVPILCSEEVFEQAWQLAIDNGLIEVI